jgi:glycosyltransferase involved in cell wall biosynthesis
LPDKYILYLGTVEPRKNIVGLIKAYNLYRSQLSTVNCQKLVVAGAWGWKTGDIRREWQASPYKNDIKFLDYIDKTDKYVVYYLSEIFVFPSFYEGFGLPILEAFASGVPVITANRASCREIAGNGASLVNPDDIGEISRAMKQLAEDTVLRENLIKKGLEISARYSWENTAKKTADLLISSFCC